MTANTNLSVGRLNFEMRRASYNQGLADQQAAGSELRKLRNLNDKLNQRMGNLRTENANLRQKNQQLLQQVNDRSLLTTLLEASRASAITPPTTPLAAPRIAPRAATTGPLTASFGGALRH